MSEEPPLNEQQVAARGRELETVRWRLPARYELQAELLTLPPNELKAKNPEMFALYQRIQSDEKRLRESAASGATMSSQDTYRVRAAQRAEEHRATIATLNKQIAAIAFGGVEGNLDELQAAKSAIRQRRAEQLAILGRFDLAAQETPDPVFREHYIAILDAVMRNDEEHCGCPEIRGSGEYSKITVPSFNQKEEVYSIAHGRVVTLMSCSTCGFLNAIDTPKHVLGQKAHRARAAQLVSGMAPEDAARTLSAKGHTAAKLLGAK